MIPKKDIHTRVQYYDIAQGRKAHATIGILIIRTFMHKKLKQKL